MWKLAVPEDALEKLRCSLCKEYLSQMPVYSYPGQEGVGCGRCPVLSDQNPIRDVSYEIVAKYLPFPCRYKPYGCLEYVLPAQMQAHEESCTYKQYFCPFIPLASCPWQGPSNELLNHYEEHHKELVLYDSRFEIDLVEMYEYNYLLPSYENLFVVHIKFDARENTFWCSVRYIGNKKAARQFVFQSVLIRHDESEKIRLPKKVVDCDNSMNLDKEIAVHVDTDDIRKILKDPCSIICHINISPNEISRTNGNDDSNDTSPSTTIADVVDENILRELECPVCNDYMVPPIHQCVTGHSICANCKSQVNECPTCRGKIQDTRNYVLENMIRHIKYCCKYRDYGCTFVSISEKIRTHESQCKFGPYECPLKDYVQCKWKGKLSDVFVHAKSEHEDHVLEVEVITFPYSDDGHDEDDEDCFLFKLQDYTFRLMFKYERNKFYWSVQMVGPPEDASKYMFELDILDNSGLHERMYFKKRCSPLTKYDDAFGDDAVFISLPKELVRSFINENDLIYKCHILKN